MSFFTSNSYFVLINYVSILRNCRVVTIQIKLVPKNSLSTAEETEAASEVVLDAFTQTFYWSWGALNAFTLHNFKCIHFFYKTNVSLFFLNMQINVEKNAMILLNMTKPPVGGGKCLFYWASHLFIHSTDSFKRQTADSFRNEAIGCPYEWATESIDSLDSFKNVHSFRKETLLCVAQRHNSSAVALI